VLLAETPFSSSPAAPDTLRFDRSPSTPKLRQALAAANGIESGFSMEEKTCR